MSTERRQLPWVKVDKEYIFDAPGGKKTLADLFEGRSQLIVYHFMVGPDWKEGCPSCSFNMDHTDAALVHLAQRDVTFAAISRATLPQIEAFKKRMGWRFAWVSSNGNDFNRDYTVSFTKEEKASGKVYYNYEITAFPSEEGPGISVFYKDKKGNIFHTYSAYARGTETTMSTLTTISTTCRSGPGTKHALPFSMAWVRHHDRYEDGKLADKDRPYWPATAASAS